MAGNACGWTRKVAAGGTSGGGMTLVEVMASLALLGSLLVGILMARGQHLRQWHAGDQKRQAVLVADQLLEGWWSNLAELPRDATGTVEQTWRWQTQVRDDAALAGLDAEVLRLEIRSEQQSLTDEPVVAVELVVPRPEAIATEEQP